jgi:hypothetical protein
MHTVHYTLQSTQCHTYAVHYTLLHTHALCTTPDQHRLHANSRPYTVHALYTTSHQHPPDSTRTGHASCVIPTASRSMVISCFIRIALAAIVTPMKKGRYALLRAYSLPPRKPPK